MYIYKKRHMVKYYQKRKQKTKALKGSMWKMSKSFWRWKIKKA